MGLKGAIRGIGTALTFSAQQQMEEQRQARIAAIQAERESALELLRQRGQRERDAEQFTRQKELITTQSNANVQQAVGTARGLAPIKRQEATYESQLEEGRQTRIAQLQSRLRRAETKEEIELRDQLDDGDIIDVEIGGDGFYYTRTSKGLTKTDIPAPERPLSEAEIDAQQTEAMTAYRESLKEWEEGGKKGPKPSRPVLTTRRSQTRVPPAPNIRRAESWKAHVPVARQLLGPRAPPEQVNAKAKELAAKYSGG